MRGVDIAALCTLAAGCASHEEHEEPEKPWSPPECPAEIRPLLGAYVAAEGQSMLVLERDGMLWVRHGDSDSRFAPDVRGASPEFVAPGLDGPASRRLAFDAGTRSPGARLDGRAFTRAPGQPGSEETFRVSHARPFAEVMAEATSATPPAEAARARAFDLVELASLDPTLRFDLRYATANNFLGVAVYERARALLQRPAAEALVRVQAALRARGLGLLIFDAYRPWAVTKAFWELTPAHLHNFVADPAQGSRHNRGCAVDLTLYDLATGLAVETTTGFDEFSPHARPDWLGGTSRGRWYRDLLRAEMTKQGFTVYVDEWWHFDYRDWALYPIGNEPL